MAKRREAAMRLLLGIVLIALVYVVGVIVSLFLFLWAAVDIIW